MTVSVDTNKKRVQGNGVTTLISFTFKVALTADLKIYKILRSDGSSVLLTNITDYSVSLDTDGEGGAVTLVSIPTSDYDILILNDPDLTQPSAFPPESDFPEDEVEKGMDRLCLLIIKVFENIGRSFRFSVTSDTETLSTELELNSFKGKIFGFDATTGEPVPLTYGDASGIIGAGSLALQNADAVDITGGDIDGVDISSSAITGGTVTNSAITGGTVTNSAITGGTVTNSAITGGTVTNSALNNVDINSVSDQTGARSALGAAASGANSDITSLNGVTSINGGMVLSALNTSAVSYSNAGTITQAHGLGRAARNVMAVLTNTSTEGNWSVGDIIRVSSYIDEVGGVSTTGFIYQSDNTNITAYIAVNGLKILNKTTHDSFVINPAKWTIYFEYN